MKFKKYVVLAVLLLITLVFSGCVNVTYKIELTDNGKANVDLTMLYNSGEYNYDYEKIDEIIAKYKQAGFKVKDITEKGMKGIQIKKENVPLNEDVEIKYDNAQIDILSDLLKETEFDKGFLSNEYEVDATIDLTKFFDLSSLIVSDTIMTNEEYNKLLSEMNLKLIIELEEGRINKTNSTLSSNTKNEAEWVLIPGAKNEIELSASTTDKITVIGTVVVLSVVVIIALIFLVMLLRVYAKKKKNN